MICNGDIPYKLLKIEYLLCRQNFMQFWPGIRSCAFYNLYFVSEGWIRQRYVKHKAVQLRFGQRIRSLLFNGILSSEDEERIWKGAQTVYLY